MLGYKKLVTQLDEYSRSISMGKKIRLLPILFIMLYPLYSVVFAGEIELKQSTSPWIIYIGGFGGVYTTDFGYGANYSTNNNGNLVENEDSFQLGPSFGGQVGFQYHFQNPYFVGFSFSVAGNENKANLTKLINGTASITNEFGLNNTFRVTYNIDTAAQIGIDLTPQTHIYIKAGASDANLSQQLETVGGRRFPNPTVIVSQTQHKNLWGLVMGLGLVRDITHWLSFFAEYNYYNYGQFNLNSLNNIAPNLDPGETDHLSQNMKLTASSVRFGVNVKLMDDFLPKMYSTDLYPWMFYVGGFVGAYSAAFDYSANYFNQFSSDGVQANALINNIVFQHGGSGGGQIGVQYRFYNPYFIGLELSAMGNSDKGHLTNTIDQTSTPNRILFSIDHQFRLQNTLDMAVKIGTDILQHTHSYVKIGASSALFSDQFSIIRNRGPAGATTSFPNPVLQETEKKHLWGLLVGLGLSYDINRWLSLFAECDYYNYGQFNLNTFSNISPGINPSIGEQDQLTQHIHVRASVVRLGLNVKLLDDFIAPVHFLPTLSPWSIYLAGFLGYHPVSFQYGSIYTSFNNVGSRSNMVFNNNAFQQSYSAGGQIGLQYHFNAPYYVGIVFSLMNNANKARLTNTVDGRAAAINTLDFNIMHEIRLKYAMDITAQLGFDVTRKTHLYIQAGGSGTGFSIRTLTTRGSNFNVPSAGIDVSQTKHLFGLVVGLGFRQDLNRWLSVFSEYNYYNYGNYHLNSLNNIVPGIGTVVATDQLAQQVTVTAYTIRAGLSIRFNI